MYAPRYMDKVRVCQSAWRCCKARMVVRARRRELVQVSLDEAWAAVFEDDMPLLSLVLPMLTDMPVRADASLLASLLHLLASLVTTATGAMLLALSEYLSNVHPILKLALSRLEGGCFGV